MKIDRWLIAVLLAAFAAVSIAAPPDSPGNKKGGGGGGSGGGGPGGGMAQVRSKDWSEQNVRKVLQAFAYGGFATDAQIAAWAAMNPADAVAEILTFSPVNAKLSAVDAANPLDSSSQSRCHSLEALQDFWSSNDNDNPVPDIDRYRYATLTVDDTPNLSSSNLQRAWIRAINTRGCNPFLHKTALYLTNYQAAISMHKVRAGLMRDYYDEILDSLISGANMPDVLGKAAVSAAVARAYGHQYNTFKNSTNTPNVNDDFAREFHQLFFRIQGETEDPVYHEDTTIEHTAWMLTGMNLDKVTGAYGSVESGDWYVAPLDYTDHFDNTGRNLKNFSNHYHSGMGASSCLEILHTQICGSTPEEKIAALAPVAAAHPESLNNVPVIIIDFFADDNLTETKKAALRSAWQSSNQNLLSFLRAYAASRMFHSADTYKFRTAFDRNLSIHNNNTLTNEESFARRYYHSPKGRMDAQGAEVFEPAHDVFGGQTGLQAATNRYIFKSAFWSNVNDSNFLRRTSQSYSLDGIDGNEYTWVKNWGSVIPKNAGGNHVVGDVARWLWNRFIADGGKNLDMIALAQIQALLATGRDFGYTVDSANPEAVYTSADIQGGNSQAAAANAGNSAVIMDLGSTTGNDRVGMAINFITMTPYTFALEGN